MSKILFDGMNIPCEQDVFDKLHHYYKTANTLLDESVESAKDDKNNILYKSKELRREIHDEYSKMSLLKNINYYILSNTQSVHIEYRSAIVDRLY